LNVHGGGNHYGTGKGQIERVRKIVRQPVGILAIRSCRGRRHCEHVVLLATEMCSIALSMAKKVGQHLAAGKRGESERTNEFLRRLVMTACTS